MLYPQGIAEGLGIGLADLIADHAIDEGSLSRQNLAGVRLPKANSVPIKRRVPYIPIFPKVRSRIRGKIRVLVEDRGKRAGI